MFLFLIKAFCFAEIRKLITSFNLPASNFDRILCILLTWQIGRYSKRDWGFNIFRIREINVEVHALVKIACEWKSSTNFITSSFNKFQWFLKNAKEKPSGPWVLPRHNSKLLLLSTLPRKVAPNYNGPSVFHVIKF